MRFYLLLWLFLIACCPINSSINVVVGTGPCLDNQRSLLLLLKKSLKFNPQKSKKLVQWNQSEDCCLWNGVTCSNGRVVALDLSQEFISGGLDNESSLFNLQYLHSLNLAYNAFHSAIPSRIHELKKFRFLNLSNAGFEGKIPIEISRLKRLVTLDLSTLYTPHHSLKLSNLSLLVQNLTEIAELHLDGVKVNSKANEWCHSLSSLQNLRVLSMTSCGLSGPIDPSLAKLHSLSVIRLSQNNMSSPLPTFFSNFSNLTILQLESCGLTGIFPKGIFKLKPLQVLDISNNLDLHGHFPNFPRHGSLHSLNLSNTYLSGLLPDSIGNLRQLSTLDLSNCQFNGSLPSSISELTQLVHLDFSINNFTGSLPSFNMSQNLAYLSLFHNKLSGSIPSSHLEGLISFASIDLGDNFFSGSIPLSLLRLPFLQRLLLPFNKFDGILEEFSNASSSMLEIIDLSSNNLQGPIPESVFLMKRLRILQLPSNKFNGTMQLDMIRKLKYLETIDLSHNNLLVDATFSDDHDLSSFPNMSNLILASCKLRALPSFLRNQSKLLILDLSSNQIQGTIPNWIFRFESLISLNLSNNFLTNLEGPFQNLSSNLYLLDLHSNQLNGSIPIFTKYGYYLDYSSNRFTSIIPPDIGDHLRYPFFLSLSNNNLSGQVHDSFCNLPLLQVLDLSHNRYDGTIPECLINHNSLSVLNLEGNKLSGQISDTISTSCSLRMLSLNGNLLEGTIPKSLINCQKIQVLNLGNNMITDRFPCFLKNISTLHILMLRSNNLYGSIQCPNNMGNWEMLQIVDLASNNFEGKLPGALFRSWKAMMAYEVQAEPKFGNIFFDMYDRSDPMRFTKSLLAIDKNLAMKFGAIIAILPRSVTYNYFSDVFYENLFVHQDSVMVVNKGQQLKLVKILSAFVSVDFSSNSFEGPIPEELMNLKALIVLDLSKNALSGQIPKSLKNLKFLESLDLSNNSLSGEIPTDLASLSFLAFLNLSFNHLVGRIPIGTQIQSFEPSSFKGNEGLCGLPLTQNCSNDESPGFSPAKSEMPHSDNGSLVDWNFLSAELGFIFGLGCIILPIIFLKQWRVRYFRHVEDILCKIVPRLDMEYEFHEGQRYRTLRWRRAH